MKKIFISFYILFFSNVSCVWGAFFYADALEQAIQEEFSEDLQSLVAGEYVAQMNQATGEIDVNGMENVCFVGGYDVSNPAGADKCKKFVKKVKNKCVYTTGDSIKKYTNPKTRQEKMRKCIFDKALDFAFSYEGGFQQDPNDTGNRVRDKDGNLLKDKNGNFVLGATKYGITTRASGLSVECVKKMTETNARHYYWTRYFYKYQYYTLPDEVLAIVMQFALAGPGVVAPEIKETVGAQSCSGVVINNCILDAVNKYIDENGVKSFYDTISALRAEKRSGTKKLRAENSVNLISAYDECDKLYVKEPL